jgi:predicted transcriptional regulator
MVTVSPEQTKPDLIQLRADCKRLHVTQDAIANAAGVTRPLVVNVFAGRSTSGNVIETVLRLIAKAEKRANRKGKIRPEGPEAA